MHVIDQQFSQLQESLGASAENMVVDSSLLALVQNRDKAALQPKLAVAAVLSNWNHVQVVDRSGQTLAASQNVDLGSAAAELERLHKLGLVGVRGIALVPTRSGWLMLMLDSLKLRTGETVGVLSVGRLLENSTLSALNFHRENPRVLLLDAEGRLSAFSTGANQIDLQEVFLVDTQAWESAQSGQSTYGQTEIQGEVQRAVYAPLNITYRDPIAGSQKVVFCVLYSTASSSPEAAELQRLREKRRR